VFHYSLLDQIRHQGRLRKWNPDHARGRRGEDLAHRFLRGKGFIIVARNYRTRSGSAEVDLIGWDGSSLVFIEVKSRASDDFGDPEDAVDREKQVALIRAAGEYIHRLGIGWNNVRFDIVSIIFAETPAITHKPDAFGSGRPL
jgi:putative endonuclease